MGDWPRVIFAFPCHISLLPCILPNVLNRMQEERDLQTNTHVPLPATRSKFVVKCVMDARVLRDIGNRAETRTRPRNIGFRWIRKIYSEAFKL